MTNPNAAPFYFGNEYWHEIYGNQNVSRTGYYEKDFVDYDAYDFKISGGLYYHINRILKLL